MPAGAVHLSELRLPLPRRRLREVRPEIRGRSAVAAWKASRRTDRGRPATIFATQLAGMAKDKPDQPGSFAERRWN